MSKTRNMKLAVAMIGLLAGGVPGFVAPGLMQTVKAQTKNITGTVIDDLGEPVIGANIKVQGTSTGTVTDLDGKFTLDAPAGAMLEISFVGYQSQTVAAKAGMVVTLSEDSQALEDVVVVGYGVQKKSSVTGAISQVKAADMQARSITNAQSALQGKTAGVNVIAANKPGESPSIRVRGFSSNNDASPLYVVDGVRLSDISGIEPNDIESMEILKDAASAAIYGAEAGNGVILITTKKGKASANKWGTITFDYQFATQSLNKKPELLNASEYIQYEAERNNLTVDQFKTNAKAAGWDGVTDTNWYDEAFENSKFHKYSVALQNATDKGSYYISLGRVIDDGIVKGSRDTYRRLTGNINADHKITSWLKVGTSNQLEKWTTRSIATGVTGYNGNAITSAMHMDPLTKAVYAPGSLTPDMQKALADGHTLLTDANGNYYGVSSFSDDMYNPLILINNGESQNMGWNVTGSAYANITPFDGFTFTSRFGYRLNASHSKGKSNKWYGFATQSNDRIDLNGQTSMGTYYQWENFANYMKTFAKKHDVNVMAGMSFIKNIYDYTRGEVSDSKGDAVPFDDWYGFSDLNNALGSADTKKTSGGETVNTSLSYYGRVGYTFDNKYMVQASFRADAFDMSKLNKNNRWGFFPAVSAGWTITRENFMESTQNWLDDLKIRGSWGQNGSISALNNYMYSSDMRSGFNVPIYNAATGTTQFVQSAFPSTMGNPELTWETSEQLDFGFDAAFLNRRLTATFDWYKKTTKDLLIPAGAAIMSMEQGGTTAAINAGNVENTGIEIELGWQDKIGDFTYSVKANLATLKNTVTSLHPSITRLNGTSCYNKVRTVFEKGHSVWHYYGYVFDKIDETGTPTFKDMDGDGAVNDADKVDIGDAVPDFTYGITLNAAWKGIDLTIFGTGSYGNQIFNNYGRGDGQSSYNKVKELFYEGRWQSGMGAGQAKLPGAAADLDWYLNSDAMVFDASFFKIKQIQLGYTLPKNWLKKAFMQNCRVYASLEDFFCFTPYLGFDPEATGGTGSAMGIDNGVYPAPKKVLLGINVTF